MKRKNLGIGFMILIGAFLVLKPLMAGADEKFKPPCEPDKALCALMIRYGDEAYSRGRYEEAKRFYRMAIAADPTSDKAWALYDRTFLADLARQVERQGKFIPYVPARDMWKQIPPTPQPVPKAQIPEVEKKAAPAPGVQEVLPSGVVIVDDEGC